MSSAAYPEHGRPDRADSVAEAAREGYTAPRSPLQADDGRSIGLVLADITANISTLLRQEVALAKAELRQSGTQAGKGIGLLAGAGVAGLLLLVFLSVSAWWGLGQYIGHEWSALVVAAVWAIIALITVPGRQGRAETDPWPADHHRNPEQSPARPEGP